MFKGFYNLTSGMLTQQRNLNVVANNLTNISTAGFKQNRYTSSTFDEVMYSRVGNTYKDDYQEIGNQSYIRATSQIYTDFEQGILEPTALSLDFAIEGEGFFAIRTEDGGTLYTRGGSFSLDDEGYLCCSGFGRVLDNEGGEIRLRTDKITADSVGNIFNENGGYLGRLGVYNFDDYEQLEHNEQGFFEGQGAAAMDTPVVYWKYVERSNTDMVQQMTEMISVQRALQSAAQLSSMYDQLMTRATSEIGQM